MRKSRIRASRACENCHAYKVKCDVCTTGLPCTNCKIKNKECRLIKSRRGTYDRQTAKQRRTEKQAIRSQEANVMTIGLQAPNVLPSAPNLDIHAFHVESAEQCIEAINEKINEQISELDLTGLDSGTSSSRRESSLSSGGSCSTPTNPSWTNLFDLYLEDNKELLEKGVVMYLGRSFPLTSILKSLHLGSDILLPNPVDAGQDKETYYGWTSEVLDAKSKAEEASSLITEISAVFPPLLELFIKEYFERAHPIYPILDRRQLAMQFETGKIPLILQYALCFCSATFCSEHTIHRARFKTRFEAREYFYKMAKSLFELHVERDKLVIMRALFLLTYWGGNPSDFWTGMIWQDCSISMSETLGMHVLNQLEGLSDRARSKWKVNFWCLATRDVFGAATFGRTLKVNIKQSNVEPLTLQDLEADALDNDSSGKSIFGRPSLLHNHYFVQMSQLGLILRKILQSQLEGQAVEEMEAGNDGMCSNGCRELFEWRKRLPVEINWETPGNERNIFSIAISLIYCHHILYFHRHKKPCYYQSRIQECTSYVVDCAAKIGRMSCVGHLPHESLLSFILANVMFIVRSSGRSKKEAQLLSLQQDLCEIVMYQAQEHWDHAEWTNQLFKKIANKVRQKTVNNTEKALQQLHNSLGDEMLHSSEELGTDIQQWFNQLTYGSPFGVGFGGVGHTETYSQDI